MLFWALALLGFAAGAGGQSGPPTADHVLRIKLSSPAAEQVRSHGVLRSATDTPARLGLAAVDRLNQRHGAVSVRPLFRTPPGFEERHRAFGLDRWFEVTFNGPREVLALSAEYENYEEIQVAEPIYEKTTLQDFPDDPRFVQQWSLRNVGQNGGAPGADISALAAWDLETGQPDVVVLVVDSGIDAAHPDLAPNLWINPNQGPENGYDGDLHGWNFVNDNNLINDTNGHGTQVAGIIAAATNNGTGIAGIAGGSGQGDGVRLMIARTFATNNANGGFAEALVYGADNGAVIANNSWGYTQPGVYEQVVLDAIDYFIANAGYDAAGEPDGPIQGGVVVFAAGNSGSSDPYYPAFYPPVVAVASTTRNDFKSVSSNFGDWIDLAAPGLAIHTTQRNGGYTTSSGTSFAAPHVAGVAALMASRFPGLPADVLVHRILMTTDPIDALNPTFSGLLGAGRLNAARALDEDPLAPPAAVDDLAAEEVRQDRLRLVWTAPASGSGAGQAAAYDLRFSTGPIDETNFAEAAPVTGLPAPAPAGTTQSVVVAGLSPDTEFWFALRSRDFLGNDSGLSNPVAATTLSPPEGSVLPASLDESLATGTSLERTVTLSNTGAGPMDFTVEDSLPGWLSVHPASGALPAATNLEITVTFDATGLANGNYAAELTFATDDPATPVLTVAIALTVTGGFPVMELSPPELDFGSVFIGYPRSLHAVLRNPGTDVLTVTTVTASGAGFSASGDGFTLPAGAETEIEVVFDPPDEGPFTGTLTVAGDAPDDPELSLTLAGEGLIAPSAVVTPAAFEVTLEHGQIIEPELTLSNLGGSPLLFTIEVEQGDQLSIALGSAEAAEPAPAGIDRVLPVDLVHDDGTPESSIGLAFGGEFLWFHRFTPPKSEFPFALDRVEIYFASYSGVQPGETFDLHLFAGGNLDAATEQRLRLPSIPVESLDAWTSIPLDTPLEFHEPGDVVIGAVNREAGRNAFPAALDESSPTQTSSWIAAYGGNVPDNPTFPATSLWGLIDNFGYPGNWLLRGHGYRIYIRPSLTAGSVPPGGETTTSILIDGSELLAGTYAFTVRIATNDPENPLIEIPGTLTVTGDPVIEADPAELDFGPVIVGATAGQVLHLRNTGPAVLTLHDLMLAGEGFSLDGAPAILAPGESLAVTVSAAPSQTGLFSGSLTVLSDDPATPELVIPLSAEGIPPPVIAVTPEALAATITRLEETSRTLTIHNTGEGPLLYAIERRLGLTHGLPVADETSLWEDPDYGVVFILDDGTVENAVGLNGGEQFIWGNQFTPEPGEYPFLLEEIHLLFDAMTDAEVGMALDLFVYQVPDGNPANGADLLLALPARQVEQVGDWSVYPLQQPLLLDGPGDILIAVVFREPVFTGFPAAIDQSSPSRGRSWIGLYDGDAPELPTLPVPGSWGTIDSFGLAGNWLIRGYGSRRFLTAEPPAGLVPPGESREVEVGLRGPGLTVGPLTFELIVHSNDPARPEVLVPVELTVTGTQRLVLAPEEAVFPESLSGETAEVVLRFENPGQDPLHVSEIHLQGEGFNFDDTAFVLPPGGHLERTLAFSAFDPGDYAGELTLASDDPQQPVRIIPLQARVVEPAVAVLGPVRLSGSGQAGDPVTLALELANEGGAALEFHLLPAPVHGGPDAAGTVWRSNRESGGPAFDWIDITPFGTRLETVSGTWDGNESINLPFPIPFYGQERATARISANGWITFGDFDGGGWIPRPLPSAFAPHALVAPYWDDLSLAAGGTVHTWHDDGPEERFIVQWTGASRTADPGDELTFQVHFSPFGEIAFLYHTVEVSAHTASVGLTADDGWTGLPVAWAEAFAEAGVAVRLLPEASFADGFSLSGSVPAGSALTFDLVFPTAGLNAGIHLQDLVLYLNDPALPEQLIPVLLEVFGEPAINVQPGILDFGTTVAGSTEERLLTVSNPGTDALQLTAVTTSHPFFSVPFEPIAIAPGKNIELPVSFNPSQAGEYSGTLTIASNAPAQSTVQLLVRGVATPAPDPTFVTRRLPRWYPPGRALSLAEDNPVRLLADPKPGTHAYAVEDTPPAGWTVDPDSISHQGRFDAVTGRVKFGPFMDGEVRELTYDLLVPLDQLGEVEFAGRASANAVSSPIGGDTVIGFNPRHPADVSEDSFVLTLDEVTGYAAAWKQGLPWPAEPAVIPISYVTRGGTLWQAGEAYRFDPAAGDPPLWWTPDEPGAGVSDGSEPSAQAGMPPTFLIDEPFDVAINVDPSPGVLTYAVEDRIPAGWQIVPGSVSHQGSFDLDASKVKFGPFFDNQARTLTYRLRPTLGVSGTAVFAGRVSFDGRDAPVSGVRTALGPPATFPEWTARGGLSGPAAHPLNDAFSQGLPNLLRYALGLDPDDKAPLARLPRLVRVDHEGAPRWALAFPIPLGPTDLDYTLESAETFSQWLPAEPEDVVLLLSDPQEGLREALLIDLATEPDTDPRRFYRLQVRLAP